mmetsp:Transcript_31464/g.75167  ORF Transcript_31464/g.75167 Transcript_31464/m.75167 type:complete len:1022 (-) Transcript_31464:63-3128(-)
MPNPKSSWRAKSQRRSHSTSTAAVRKDVSISDLASMQYEQQLNPYKQTKSLRGSQGSAGMDIDEIENLGCDVDVDLHLGDGDDELGLDSILSCLVDNLGKDEGVPLSSNGKLDRKHLPDKLQSFRDDKTSEVLDRIIADGSGAEKPINDKNSVEGIDSTSDPIGTDTLEGGTLFTDGDATREHRLMIESGQTPAFTSGFAETAKSGSPPSNPLSAPPGPVVGESGNSLLDSLIDGIDEVDRQEEFNPTIAVGDRPSNTSTENRHKPSKIDAINYFEPREDKKKKRNLVLNFPSTLPEDETLSTVTDPTESPFIYTYKKQNSDEDSLSQITSSLAGNSLISHKLQSVPNSDTSGPKSVRNRGLSWMNDSGGGPHRTQNRKSGLTMTGAYGRARGRRSSSGRSSNSSGNGSLVDDLGKTDVDEIAYSLNAENATSRAPRPRRPPRREIRRASNTHADGVSTMDQSNAASAYIDVNGGNSLISRLGMGGISAAPDVRSVSEVSESSNSTLGLGQSISLLLWKAQHHATRFLFPPSPAVKNRKKFDRSDSLSDIEEILLEEGTPNRNHKKDRRSLSEESEEEIDYFGRAMSSPRGNSSRKSKRRKYFWHTGKLHLALVFSGMTVVFTLIRAPSSRRRWRHQNIDPSLNGEQGQPALLEGAYDQTFDQPYSRVDNNGLYHDQVGEPLTVIDPTVEALHDDFNKQNGAPPEAEIDEPESYTRLKHRWQTDSVDKYAIAIPPVFEAIADVDDGLFQRGVDLPFFWHVPRSGGGTMNDVLGSCLHLTLAADAGEGEDLQNLKVLRLGRQQVQYVNIDTSTHEGIERARNLGLASSGLADVVLSPLLHEASSLFNQNRKGRLFTMVRHPVERAASLFYFIQETQWQKPGTRNDQFAEITIEQFYRGGFAENNWMTRFLTNELTKPELTEVDLNIAKEILRKKCLIGLLEEKGETMERIQRYFGWRPQTEADLDCLSRKVDLNWPMKHKHPSIEEGSRAWRLITAQNKLDLELYNFAKFLFSKQGEQLSEQ